MKKPAFLYRISDVSQRYDDERLKLAEKYNFQVVDVFNKVKDWYGNEKIVAEKKIIAMVYIPSILRVFMDNGKIAMKQADLRQQAEKYCCTKADSNADLFRQTVNDKLVERIGHGPSTIYKITKKGEAYLNSCIDNYDKCLECLANKAKTYQEYLRKERKELLKKL